MRRPPNRWQRGGRCYPKKASLAPTEPPHVGFILCNPPIHLFSRKFSRLGPASCLPAQLRGEIHHQFLFLLWRQGSNRCFYFCKVAHDLLGYEITTEMTRIHPLLFLSSLF